MQTIQNPKHTVYLAASWNDEHEEMNLHIAELLAAHGLVVVGDHRDYRDYRDAPHERGLDYRARVDEILVGCSGMALVFPKQHWAQTTSCRTSTLPTHIFHIWGITATKRYVCDAC